MDLRSLRIAASLCLLTWLLPAALDAAERDRVLEWIPPAGSVDGYRVHVGATSSRYDDVLDLGSVPKDPDGICRSTVVLAAERDYYIAVSAYNAAGESALSNEIRVEASACDPAACDDGAVCTADDCGALGCSHDPLPDGTSCEDAGGAGLCMQGVCEIFECRTDGDCDDGNLCNGFESCGADGSCSAGAPLSCGQPSACASPACDPLLGCISIAVPNGTACNDRNTLTSGDQCQQGVCRGRRGKPERGGGGRPRKGLGGL